METTVKKIIITSIENRIDSIDGLLEGILEYVKKYSVSIAIPETIEFIMELNEKNKNLLKKIND